MKRLGRRCTYDWLRKLLVLALCGIAWSEPYAARAQEEGAPGARGLPPFAGPRGGRPGVLRRPTPPSTPAEQEERGAEVKNDDGSRKKWAQDRIQRARERMERYKAKRQEAKAPNAPSGPKSKKGDDPAEESPENATEILDREGNELALEENLPYKPLPGGTKVILNFNKANIEEVVQTISKLTGRNFILSDRIRASKVTILSPSKVTVHEAWAAFLSALEVAGLSIVPSGRYLKIVESNKAREMAVRTFDGRGGIPDTDEVVTQLIVPTYLDVMDIQSVIGKLKSRSGDVTAYAPTNTLIVTDMASNIRRIMRILHALDSPLGSEQIWVVEVQYAEATEISRILLDVFQQKGKGTAKVSAKTARPPREATKEEDDEEVNVSKIVADERTNQLIVVANERSFRKILELIDKLDTEIPGDSQIHVQYLENADAEELANTLSTLTSGLQQNKRRPQAKGAKPTKQAGELFEGEVKITADKSTNSLVIIASRKDFVMLKENMIVPLDIRRPQVYVEAVIMEVSLDKTRDIGMSFNGGMTTEIDGETVPFFGGTTFGSLSSIMIDPTSLMGLAAGTRGPPLPGTEGIIPGLEAGLPAFGVILRLLQTDNNVNVLSTPHILTTDNEEAEIIVGQNVPFISGFTSGFTGGGTTFNPIVSIQRQDVALKLKLTPQVNESDFVRLNLEQEITELASISETLGPTTSKRSAKTTVVVKDQQTVVIGGLIKDNVTEDIEKIPFLGDIPVLGALFRTTKTRTSKQNLLMFLTPYIIKDSSDFHRIFKRKMEERRQFIEQFVSTAAKDYTFPVEYARKKGLVEEINQTFREEKQKTQAKREQEQQELQRQEWDRRKQQNRETPLGTRSETREPQQQPPTAQQ